jgi:hypothetical protein
LYRDERLREARPELIHLASLDMESPGIKGTSTLQHHSGQHGLRFDSTTREMKPLRWIVPADRDSGSFTFSANAEVLQQEDDNFIALVISVIRDGKELTCSYTRSSEQMVTFGQWGHVGAVFRPTVPLLPGDIVQLRAWPLSPSSVMYLDDLELRILQ